MAVGKIGTGQGADGVESSEDEESLLALLFQETLANQGADPLKEEEEGAKIAGLANLAMMFSL